MPSFPYSLESNQTLYSVIPLALDTSSLHLYQSHLKNSSGDCQLFSTEELISNEFSYINKRYNILLDASEKSSKPHQIHNVPFTCLLVGQTYACQEVIANYHTWGKLDSHSEIILPSRKKNYTHDNKTITNYEDCWLPIQHPAVWAQASFTNVSVTTAYPNSLEKELSRIFNFPISVSPLNPLMSNKHNEFAARLASIYALVASRNLYRTVLCHSHMWMHQMQFFSNIYKDIDYIPEVWKPLVRVPSVLLQEKNMLKEATDIKARELSQYDIRLQTYKSKNSLMARVIGKGSTKTHVLPTQKLNQIISQEDIKIQIEYNEKAAKIISPLYPDQGTKEFLTKMLAKKLKIEPNRVQVILSERDTKHITQEVSYFPILTNMLLYGMKKITPSAKWKKKEVTLSNCSFIGRKNTSATTILEFEAKKYINKIILSKATIVVSSGYIYDKKPAKGVIEATLFSTFFSLYNHYQAISKDFNLHVEFINGDDLDFTGSFTKVIQYSIVHAILDATRQMKETDIFLSKTYTKKTSKKINVPAHTREK